MKDLWCRACGYRIKSDEAIAIEHLKEVHGFIPGAYSHNIARIMFAGYNIQIKDIRDYSIDASKIDFVTLIVKYRETIDGRKIIDARTPT